MVVWLEIGECERLIFDGLDITFRNDDDDDIVVRFFAVHTVDFYSSRIST
jgi:hypothetical protein